MRLALGIIGFAYIVFSAILLVAPDRYDAITNTFRYDSSPYGPWLFALFGAALISHVAVAVISRSWLYWIYAASSALLLAVLFLRLLYKITGDSL